MYNTQTKLVLEVGPTYTNHSPKSFKAGEEQNVYILN